MVFLHELLPLFVFESIINNFNSFSLFVVLALITQTNFIEDNELYAQPTKLFWVNFIWSSTNSRQKMLHSSCQPYVVSGPWSRYNNVTVATHVKMRCTAHTVWTYSFFMSLNTHTFLFRWICDRKKWAHPRLTTRNAVLNWNLSAMEWWQPSQSSQSSQFKVYWELFITQNANAIWPIENSIKRMKRSFRPYNRNSMALPEICAKMLEKLVDAVLCAV